MPPKEELTQIINSLGSVRPRVTYRDEPLET